MYTKPRKYFVPQSINDRLKLNAPPLPKHIPQTGLLEILCSEKKIALPLIPIIYLKGNLPKVVTRCKQSFVPVAFACKVILGSHPQGFTRCELTLGQVLIEFVLDILICSCIFCFLLHVVFSVEADGAYISYKMFHQTLRF